MIEFDLKEARWADEQLAISAIRRAVFIDEQGVPEALEWDGLDADASHVLAYVDGRPIATGRLLASGHIGRMAVLADFRGFGIGAAVLGRLLALAKRAGLTKISLNAQVHAQGFYARHGFVAQGATFLDAGIPHVAMRIQL